MKPINNFRFIAKSLLLPAMGAALLSGCYDTKMEWGTPEGHLPVSTADMPLEVKECVANYDDIKVYAKQHTPNLLVGLGFDATMYINDYMYNGGWSYRTLTNNNFEIVTPGNELKMDAIVNTKGELHFEKIDEMLDAMSENPDLRLYGHNFLWHTQQQQNYLLSLIAPEIVVDTDSDIKHILGGDAIDFDKGTFGGWDFWGDNMDVVELVGNEGPDGTTCAKLKNLGTGNAWEAQFFHSLTTPLDMNTEYTIRFKAKSTNKKGELQFVYQNGTYDHQDGYKTFTLSKEWATYEFSFKPKYDDITRIVINFGAVVGTYYIDDIEFGTKKTPNARHKINQKTSYVIKTPEEKRTILLNAMESWISGMAAHFAEKGVVPYGYDVINEAIADGHNTPRGIKTNNVLAFDGTDKEPVETETDGMTLNWANGHFYWGYFIGKDYALKAYQFARKYLPAETKLFYNDYNLETSPSKRKAVIEFLKSIDEANGSPIVDGIGTQCHLNLDITSDDSFADQIEAFMAQVDGSLTELASTGKIVRITELDITLGTATPSRTQLEAQYEAYRRVFESYKRIIPASQQSGITLWSLSDDPEEHKYWLDGQSPNIYDKDGLRKWAYKGVCDGLAGEDIGLQFKGDDYKAWHENHNTGNW